MHLLPQFILNPVFSYSCQYTLFRLNFPYSYKNEINKPLEALLNRLFYLYSREIAVVLLSVVSALSLPILSQPHYADAHSTIDGGAVVEIIDNKYQIAFQQYPKFVSAGQDAAFHFSIFDKSDSNLFGVYAALVMKEKESGSIVEQMPYRFYESSDISIPYTFHDNSDYVVTLLARTSDDPKYLTTPLQVDFDASARQTTTISTNDLLLMVVPFTAALVGGFVFLFRKRDNQKEVDTTAPQSQ
jgi:hypothetical protein